MAHLLSLPAELLQLILLQLDKPNLKQLRAVSHECEELATSYIFCEVPFDLEPGGCDSLAAIARHPKLQRNLHTVYLRHRRGLKSFDSFEGWCPATIYEHIPWQREDGPEYILPSSYSMSQEEWDALNEKDREHLYEEYEGDKRAFQSQNSQSDTQQNLLGFRTAMNALTSVSAFAYTPVYDEDEDNWGRTWRKIEFHSEGLVDHGGYGNDVDIDALQLFIALRVTMLAPNALHSVELFSRGYAFWGTLHLRRLFDWSDRVVPRSSALFDSVEEEVERWYDGQGGLLAAMKDSEALTRHIVGWERAFSRVTRLSSRIDTSWSEGSNELVTIAASLSNVLKEAKGLEELDLVFRDHANADNNLYYKYYDRSCGLRYWKHNHLLEKAPSLEFHHLRYLHLSFATCVPHLLPLFEHLNSIRHLRPNHIALLPGGGCWEKVLHHIAQHLQLHRIELKALEDIHDRKPRLLLDPGVEEWTNDPANTDRYAAYEEAIVRYTLRLSQSCPPLSPSQYLKQFLGRTET
ncbi:hypothetical protein ACLMJK_003832 [Lecanora helva]